MVLRVFPTQDGAGQLSFRTAAACLFCNFIHSGMPRVFKTFSIVSSVCAH